MISWVFDCVDLPSIFINDNYKRFSVVSLKLIKPVVDLIIVRCYSLETKKCCECFADVKHEHGDGIYCPK